VSEHLKEELSYDFVLEMMEGETFVSCLIFSDEATI